MYTTVAPELDDLVDRQDEERDLVEQRRDPTFKCSFSPFPHNNESGFVRLDMGMARQRVTHQ